MNSEGPWILDLSELSFPPLPIHPGILSVQMIDIHSGISSDNSFWHIFGDSLWSRSDGDHFAALAVEVRQGPL